VGIPFLGKVLFDNVSRLGGLKSVCHANNDEAQ